MGAIISYFKNADADELLAYKTFKMVKVKDRRLGLLQYAFTLCIIGYMIYDLVTRQKFLKKEPPIGGYTRMSLRTASITAQPSYCSATEVSGCLYLNADRILNPVDQFMITTRISIENMVVANGCDIQAPATPNCEPSVGSETHHYIGGIEDATIMFEHSVRGDTTGLTLRNGELVGTLLSSNGTIVQQFYPQEGTQVEDESLKRPSGVPGDIIKVSKILEASGITSLQDQSISPSGQVNSESLRYAGLVVVILVEYSNAFSDPNALTYRYRPVVIPGAEAKAIETISPNQQWNRHGIKFQLVQTGEIGRFEFVALLTNLVASIALFKLASVFVELMMLRVLPQKKLYEQYKYQSTADFSDLRSDLKGGKQVHLDRHGAHSPTSVVSPAASLASDEARKPSVSIVEPPA